jgi:hypothetical protein
VHTAQSQSENEKNVNTVCILHQKASSFFFFNCSFYPHNKTFLGLIFSLKFGPFEEKKVANLVVILHFDFVKNRSVCISSEENALL